MYFTNIYLFSDSPQTIHHWFEGMGNGTSIAFFSCMRDHHSSVSHHLCTANRNPLTDLAQLYTNTSLRNEGKAITLAGVLLL